MTRVITLPRRARHRWDACDLSVALGSRLRAPAAAQRASWWQGSAPSWVMRTGRTLRFGALLHDPSAWRRARQHALSNHSRLPRLGDDRVGRLRADGRVTVRRAAAGRAGGRDRLDSLKRAHNLLRPGTRPGAREQDHTDRRARQAVRFASARRARNGDIACHGSDPCDGYVRQHARTLTDVADRWRATKAWDFDRFVEWSADAISPTALGHSFDLERMISRAYPDDRSGGGCAVEEVVDSGKTRRGQRRQVVFRRSS